MSDNEDNIIDIEPETPEEEARKQELLAEAKEVVSQRKGRKKKPKFDWSSQAHLILSGALLSVIVLYAAFGLCRKALTSKPREGRVVTAESLLPAVIEYGGEKLSGKVFVKMEATRTDKDPELVDAIKQVIDQGGMPADVFQDDVPPEMNIGTELSRAFEIYKNSPGELERLRERVPRGPWKIDPETLQEVGDILVRTEQKRMDIREMLNKNDVCFSFTFVHNPEFGDVPDTSAADFLGDYILLEEFSVARSLDEGNIGAATVSLAYMFRLSQLAAEVKNVGIRTRAGEIRMRTVDIMQAVVLDPNFKEKNAVFLLEMLQEQLDAWTPDSAMWIGDRASGLVVFNLIRQHGLDSALEPEELAELRQRGVYDTVVENLLHNLSKDQTTYLKAMDRVIEECKKPFYLRVPELKRIDSDLRLQRGLPSEPVITEILLRGVTEVMKYCAQDRAKLEAAVLALATTLKRPVATTVRPQETLELDPLFGRKYEIRKISAGADAPVELIRVSYHSDLKPFQVPDFSKGK